MIKTLSLYEDQKELIVSLREAMRKHKAILLQSPTGSGKTAMAVYMIMKACEKQADLEKLRDRKIIFTVPRKDLLEQTSDTLCSYSISHSYIAAGKPYNPSSPVYIGMVPTMTGRIDCDKETGVLSSDKLPKGYIVLIDETHFGSENLGKLIEFYKNQGAWVIGLSATPWKLNGQGLGVWYDCMVKGKSIQWLIENKRLSDYDYYYGRTKPDLSGIKVGDGDYNQVQLGQYMEQQGIIIGDCVNDYLSRCNGRLHIVRCASIKHSQMVAETFRKAGVNAIHVDGETPMDERKRIFVAYAKKEITVLTFCDLLNFGFDLSQASGMDVCIESASDLKPTKSLAAQLQFWGRVLRYKDYPAIINDHVNNYIEHGLPCSEREWTLESRKKGKKGDSEPAPPSRQCPKCYYVHSPSPACPQCGFVYPVYGREIEEMDGELVKVDKEELKRIKQEQKYQRLDEQQKAETMEDLIKLAKSRGYNSPVGWAARIYQARQLKKQKGNAA